MGTRDSARFIRPVSPDYSNLKEEVLAIHSKLANIDTVDTELQSVKTDVDNLKSLDLSNINTPVLQELDAAKGSYSTLDARLTAMNAYTILNQLEKLSTNRVYEYNDQGYVTKEIVTGDINTTIVYIYDAKWNVKREEHYDGSNNLIGYKDYTYDEFGEITSVNGVNADDVDIASNSVLFQELDTRIKALEGIDFVKLAASLQGADVGALLKSIQNILTRVTTLENYLPGNVNNLIQIPDIIERLNIVENKLNQQYVLYTFDVYTGKTVYDIPAEITDKCAVYLEGLLLDYGDDYTIADSKMTFNIPLIDTFTVTCKY